MSLTESAYRCVSIREPYKNVGVALVGGNDERCCIRFVSERSAGTCATSSYISENVLNFGKKRTGHEFSDDNLEHLSK